MEDSKTSKDQADAKSKAQNAPAAVETKTGRKKLPKLLPVALIAALLVGGGAYAYTGVYKQQPSVLWDDAMSNTSKGLSQLSSYDNLTQEGSKFNASFNVEKPLAASGSISGKARGNQVDVSGSVSASGAKVDFSVLSKTAEGSEYPDIYAKVTGLSSVTAFTGPQIGAQLAQFENQWFFVDHTLLAQAANSAAQSGTDKTDINFTEEDIKKIRENYTNVLNDYVFTSDKAKAIASPTGDTVKEDFDGHASVKYKVELNKDNLKSFTVALKDAAKGTKLESMLGAENKTLDETFNFDELSKEIDKIDTGKATAEVWVDKGTRLVRNIRIAPEVDNGTATVDIGLDYNGGDELPFYIRINGDDDEAKGTIAIGLKANKNSSKAELTVNVDMDFKAARGQDIKASLKLTSEPSNEDVNPAKPDGAKNIMEVFGMGSDLQSFEDPSAIEESDLPALYDDFEL